MGSRTPLDNSLSLTRDMHSLRVPQLDITTPRESQSADSPVVPAVVTTPLSSQRGSLIEAHRRSIMYSSENILLSPRPPYNPFHNLPADAQVEDHLKLDHLQSLMKAFNEHQPPEDASKKQKDDPGLLSLEEFKDTVAKVLGTRLFDDQLTNLFRKLDLSGEGLVDWNAFCTYLLLQLREKDFISTRKHARFDLEHRVRHIVQNRQETTSKIITVDGPVRHVSFSKEGVMCIWDSHLHLERHYNVHQGEKSLIQSQKQRVKTWVMDAVFMPNCRKLVVGSTGRDLKFYDLQSNQYHEEFYLYGLPAVPCCFHYWYDSSDPGSESLLIFGDDQGSIHTIRFHKPQQTLFHAPNKSAAVIKIYVDDLDRKHGKFVKLTTHEGVHPDFVRRVRYMPENESIISASNSHRHSLVIMDVDHKRKPYIFNLTKGVQCFDYSKTLNMLVTGSSDHMVRLWNPYVPSKPTAVLDGHVMGVVDVVIHENLNLAISLAKDNVLRVWDMKEQACIQSIIIKYPSSLAGKFAEHGNFALHLYCGATTRLLASSDDYIAMLYMGSGGQIKSSEPTTHLAQLCGAIYNQHFKQVVTGADDSTVALWDLETGRKSMVFTDAHGKEEITCLTFDDSCRQLLTGARNGTVKVWNVQNGHCLHHLEAIEDAEVTGIVPLSGKKQILSVGWSRAITVYDDSKPENVHIKGNTLPIGKIHDDDIISADFCSPLLATGSFDGEISVWTMETQNLYVRLRRGYLRRTYKHFDVQETRSESARSGSSRPNSRHRSSHKHPKGAPAPVDALMFLKHRFRDRMGDSAVLVSSEAGVLHWWCVKPTFHNTIGHFYAPEIKDESILGLASDHTNKVLIVGDTKGFISVWDIENYCLKPQKQRGTRPSRVSLWSAHESALVSVEYVEHDSGQYVVSASTDKTAKLWTLEGQCVGMFGQKNAWNLKIKGTWEKKMQDQANEEAPAIEVQDEYDCGFAESSQEIGTTQSSPEKELRGSSNSVDILRISEDSPLPASLISSLQSSSSPGTWGTSVASEGITRAESVVPNSNLITSNDISPGDVKSPSQLMTSLSPLRQTRSGRASTRSINTSRPLFERAKTLLGDKVENELNRRQKDRHERRGHFGDIMTEKTNRMGQQCTPFHALSTLTLNSTSLPLDLPVSSRMKSRGYTASDLSAPDNLMSMDLSHTEEVTAAARNKPPSRQASRLSISQKGRYSRYGSAAQRFPSIGEKPNVLNPLWPAKKSKMSAKIGE